MTVGSEEGTPDFVFLVFQAPTKIKAVITQNGKCVLSAVLVRFP